MRVFFASLLVLGPCLSAHYAQGQASPAAKANAEAATGILHRSKRYTSQLGPTPNQRPVKLERVLQKPAYYAATLPVLRDKDGRISLTMVVNPQTHSVQELKALFAPLDKSVTYNQVGEGISLYDAPTGRYYFNALYQKVRQLPAGVTEHGSIRQIKGWLEPSTSRAAVAEEAIPDEVKNSTQGFLRPAN